MDKIRIFTGLALLVLGVFLVILSFIVSWVFLVYGILIFIIGILLLIDFGKESYIEPIAKQLKSTNKNK
ncbi:MAG: hypothetical protein WC781_02750 [Candidatus Pacearchaeota archaeon]|jgi:membrane-bound ClpP family serine protease